MPLGAGRLHVDVTIIKLLDGTRCYLHGVIDGFSRRVLAWTLRRKLSAEGTRQILAEAALACATSQKIKVLTDGGSENMTITSQVVTVALHTPAVRLGGFFGGSSVVPSVVPSVIPSVGVPRSRTQLLVLSLVLLAAEAGCGLGPQC